MNPTGGHTSGLSPDACQTAIDGIAWERYMRENQPGYLSARDGAFFKPVTPSGMVFIWDEDANVGEFQETGEQEEILNSDTRIGNTKTKRQTKWTKQIPVSFEAFLTDKVGKRERIGQQIGDRAKLTQDRRAVLQTYGDAFAGSVNTTPDGQALASNSHVTIGGGGVTVDNLEQGLLNPDNLWTNVQSLANQKAQDGDAGSQVFQRFVTNFLLYKTAKEILNSTLIANSAENNLNIYDTDYGEVAIKASVFLNSAYNSATNAATSYHVMSENHMISRQVLSDLNMDMIEPKYTANDTWAYRARYMESVFPESWTGYVGCNGSAAS